MTLHQRIAAARKNKGLTQEELASLTKLTVRTIQRIESGESIPRSFTLRSIAAALDKPLEYLMADEAVPANSAAAPAPAQPPGPGTDADIHFMQMFNLSCFLYIILPFVHFLVPAYLLKNRSHLGPALLHLGRRIIRQQVYWVIATHLLLLLTLAYNFLQAYYLENRYVVHFLWPFFIMYFLNASLILMNAARINRPRPAHQAEASTN
jgi:XRE family transcriptional regulator, regulator of sulfur utilization